MQEQKVERSDDTRKGIGFWTTIMVVSLALAAYFVVPWVEKTCLLPIGDVGALYSGLAFLVIYFTFLSQNKTTVDTLSHLEHQALHTERLALAQALGLERQNVGARIHFLKGLMRPREKAADEAMRIKERNLEELADDEATWNEICRLKGRLTELDGRIEDLLGAWETSDIR